MKRTKILYWIFTGLLSAMMLLSGIPSILMTQDSIALMSTHLGYPVYLIPLLGYAKTLGAIAILIPGFPRIKEWIYAGFTFDLLGAMYSFIAIGDPVSGWAPLFVCLALIVLSYIYHHKKLSGK